MTYNHEDYRVAYNQSDRTWRWDCQCGASSATRFATKGVAIAADWQAHAAMRLAQALTEQEQGASK